MNEPPPASAPTAPFAIAIIPVVALVGLLYLNVRIFQSGNNQVALVLATMVAAVLSIVVLKQPWKTLEQGMLNAIRMAMQAILILMTVGLLIAAWIEAMDDSMASYLSDAP